jgi:hypothetical protein
MLDDPKQFRLAESQDQKLTDWANEPDLLMLKGDLEAARPSQQAQVTKINEWNDMMAVRGKHKPKALPGRSSVQPKLVRRQAEWRYSALTEPFLGSHKLFSIRGKTHEDAAAAKQNELVINWQFQTKMNRVKLIDDFIRSTVDDGTSVLRIGWQRTTITVKVEVPVYTHYALETPEQAEQLELALALKQEDPRGYNEKIPEEVQACVALFEETGEATYAMQTGVEMRDEEKILQNFPTVEVIDSRNFFVDPSCNGDFSKAQFAIYSFETNYAKLKKEPKRYKNLDRVNWEDNAPLNEVDHHTKTPGDFQFRDRARKVVVAYEYWGFYDIEGDGTLVPFVCTWIGDTIIRMELNPYPDEGLPFVVVPYNPVKRGLYGEPDAELLGENQAILGAVTRGSIDLLGRSANSQRGFRKGALDPVNRKRYDEGKDYEFNPTSDPQGNVLEHKYPELPRSGLEMMALQNQDAEALTGVKSFSGGISGETYGEVAAGVRGVMDAASKREMAILRRLARGMSEVGMKIVAMNSLFLSEKEIVRVTNTEFVEINREDLKGNFDLEVDISTAEVDNIKAQDLAFMLQTMGPNMSPEISLMILSEIALLKRMPHLAQKIATYKPQPDPKQQAEVAKLQAEAEELASQTRLNDAKAQEAMANKAKADLDFVEQESGVKHERDLQKQAGQARGNQALEVTKALVKPRKEGESSPDVEAAIGFNAISDKLAKVADTRDTDPLPPGAQSPVTL